MEFTVDSIMDSFEPSPENTLEEEVLTLDPLPEEFNIDEAGFVIFDSLEEENNSLSDKDLIPS